jgi:excisionase family DNA binding protein
LLAAVEDVREILTATRKEYYTVGEVARLTGRTPYTVRRWLSEGRLPAIRVEGTGPRGRLLIPGSHLTRLLPQGLGGDLPQTGTTSQAGGTGVQAKRQARLPLASAGSANDDRGLQETAGRSAVSPHSTIGVTDD